LLQREISEDKKWRTDFKEDLDGLLKALKEAKENRQEQYKQIESKISGIEEGSNCRQICTRSLGQTKVGSNRSGYYGDNWILR
jgi:hypothetical protein